MAQSVVEATSQNGVFQTKGIIAAQIRAQTNCMAVAMAMEFSPPLQRRMQSQVAALQRAVALP